MDNRLPQAQPTTVERCFKCFVEFGWFKRKHSCRSCGKLFCDNCSANRRALQPGGEQICDYCALQQFSSIPKPAVLVTPGRAQTMPAQAVIQPLMKAPMSPQGQLSLPPSYDTAVRRSPSPVAPDSGPALGPSLNTIISAGPSSVLRDLSPLQAASRVPDDIAQKLIDAGFDRSASAEFYHALSQRGVLIDDVNAILRRLVSQWRISAGQSAMARSSQAAALSDSLLEEQEQQKLKERIDQSGSSSSSSQSEGSVNQKHLDLLRLELMEANSKLAEQKREIEFLKSQMQEVESQVLGGFSFSTWKKVQQMSADQTKSIECVVCLDADASVVTSCGCKCMCSPCYEHLPRSKVDGLRQCPQCSKPTR